MRVYKILCLIFLLALVGFGQQGATITGKVLLLPGMGGVSRSDVTLKSTSDPNLIYTTEADEDGNFSLGAVPLFDRLESSLFGKDVPLAVRTTPEAVKVSQLPLEVTASHEDSTRRLLLIVEWAGNLSPLSSLFLLTAEKTQLLTDDAEVVLIAFHFTYLWYETMTVTPPPSL